MLYFCLAVCGTIAAFYAAFAALLRWVVSSFFEPGTLEGISFLYDGLGWWDTELFLLVSMIITALILIGSTSKAFQLSKGGAYVAMLLGGRPLDPNTLDKDERRLLHVVEEMSIASGTPVPQIFILRREMGINAFAAGFSPADSAIGVTQGTLKGLTRSELQGVIAHEFSHILNGDMALNMKLTSLTHGIVFIAFLGQMLLRFLADAAWLGAGRSRRSSRDKGGGAILLLVFLVAVILVGVGSIGVFFARLIQSAVSRQREFLADAAAVQFTRNKEGILGVLLKLGGYKRGSKMRSAYASDAGHFFFGNALSGWSGIFATHPPLLKRIRAIDPHFDGKYPEFFLEDSTPVSDQYLSSFSAGSSHVPPSPVPVSRGASSLSSAPSAAADLIRQIGNLSTGHIDYAEELRKKIPSRLYEATHQPFGARAVVYALLLNSEAEIREKQLSHLEEKADPPVFKELQELLPLVSSVGVEHRLPLIDLAIPALRNLSPSQYQTFKANVASLIEADGGICLFEYTLQRILLQHLDRFFEGKPALKVKYYGLIQVIDASSTLLSALAYLGHDDPGKIQTAFRDGSAKLNICDVDFQIKDASECDLAQIDEALQQLMHASPTVKKNVLYACATTAMSDRTLTQTEEELLRAIADSLGCPIPPFLRESSKPHTTIL